MGKTIGIRREDKNVWERRVPLVPDAIGNLIRELGISCITQPSPNRIFSDELFREAGALVDEDLGSADVVFAVKEIPQKLFLPGKTYVFFSHTIKGQPYNMAMLEKMMELRCQLIDYERIVNESNQRLIFFGKFAGYAGMIDTLHALGQKLKARGLKTPMEKISMAYQYNSLESAKEELKQIGREISKNKFPPGLSPLVIGITGYGNVSQGAQEILDVFPHQTISPKQLIELKDTKELDSSVIYKVVFREEDLVSPRSGKFDLQEYYQKPDLYESQFEQYIPHMTALVNCIYWTDKYPRLITPDNLMETKEERSQLKLLVIGDISADIEGSIQITSKVTTPDMPCFTYYPEKSAFEDGIQADGLTIMAVDNLPCEFSRESSEAFSEALSPFVKEIVSTDFSKNFSELELSSPIKNALILHGGRFTENYLYMGKFLEGR